ncbi:MAG: hypothetical protein ACM3SX_17240 [Deltaproteobacteria bacterium]
MNEPAANHGSRAFTRWPGLLSLSLGVLLGPTVALINQGLIYSANMWACGHGAWGTLHVIPLLCVIVAIGAGLTARRDWKAVGGGVHDEDATVEQRTRFVALLGMALSAFSAAVIIAQWVAIVVFEPCMRA